MDDTFSPTTFLQLGIYALFLIEILIRVCFCFVLFFFFVFCFVFYFLFFFFFFSFEFVIVVKKIDHNFPLSALLLHKKNFVKNDRNFAVKALGCAPWFPSLVIYYL